MANVYYAYDAYNLYLSNSDLSSDSIYGTLICGIYAGDNSNTSYNKSNCTKITILNEICPDSCQYYFNGFQYVTEIIGLDKIDTSNVTNMSGMFKFCSKLVELDLSSFNTNNVTTMEQMFVSCRNLTTIYSNNFDISKVTSSLAMFGGCTNLVGAVPYDSTQVTATMANYDTGYFTKPSAVAYVRTLQDEHDCIIYPQTISGAVGIEQEMFGSAAGTSTTEVLKKLAGVDVENKKIIDYQGNELEVGGDSVVYIDFEMGEEVVDDLPENVIMMAMQLTTDFDLKTVSKLIFENKTVMGRMSLKDNNGRIADFALFNLIQYTNMGDMGQMLIFALHYNLALDIKGHNTGTITCFWSEDTSKCVYQVISDEPAESGAGVTLVRWEEA